MQADNPLDGFFVQLKLPPELMRRIAAQCPAVTTQTKDGSNRKLRLLLENDDQRFISQSLIEELTDEVARNLEQHGINAAATMSSSHFEWIIAPPNCRSKRSGDRHRDVSRHTLGVITILVFFGDTLGINCRKTRSNSTAATGYGSVEVWRNSQNLLPGSMVINESRLKNHLLELRRRHGSLHGTQVPSEGYNCCCFDSRLFHESLPHQQLQHRAALGFYLRLPTLRRPTIQPTGYIEAEECSIIDLSKYIVD